VVWEVFVYLLDRSQLRTHFWMKLVLQRSEEFDVTDDKFPGGTPELSKFDKYCDRG